jgi:hypothetical protein
LLEYWQHALERVCRHSGEGIKTSLVYGLAQSVEGVQDAAPFLRKLQKRSLGLL